MQTWETFKTNLTTNWDLDEREWLVILAIPVVLAILILFIRFDISSVFDPPVGSISGATEWELDRSCEALARAGYDYWSLNILAVGGRTVEVAADIHTHHPGPYQTQEYCRGRF